jgi:signal transduction histidine kinase
MEDSMLAYQARLRALTVRLADVREVERERLSKDLHDCVGHELGLARFKLSQLLQEESENLSPSLEEGLAQLENHVRNAIQYTRTLGYEYYPQVLMDAGLLPALEWLSVHFADQQNIPIQIHIDDTCGELQIEPTLRGRIFTSVRECVFNAWKYSEANRILLTVKRQPDAGIEISIIDDGKGFDVELLDNLNWEDGGFGLFSIREMMQHMGGHFSCESAPQKGTRITLGIPEQECFPQGESA